MATKRTGKAGNKRSLDVNQWAHQIGRLSTENYENGKAPGVPPEVRKYMAEIGRKGGQIGGKKRLETLTQARRSHIALKAAEARWSKAKKP